MKRFLRDISRGGLLALGGVLCLVLAVAVEELPAAQATTIDASAMGRDGGAKAAAKIFGLPVGGHSSRVFNGGPPPSVTISQGAGYAIAPYGDFPLIFGQPLLSNPTDPASAAAGCNVYFDGVWMGGDAIRNTLDAGVATDPPAESTEPPPIPAANRTAAHFGPEALASDRAVASFAEADDDLNVATIDRPAVSQLCPKPRRVEARALTWASFGTSPDTVAYCRRPADARLCEWRCEESAGETPLAGACPFSRSGYQLALALADVGSQPLWCGGRCGERAEATPPAGFCSRWLQANASALTTARFIARPIAATGGRGRQRKATTRAAAPRLCAWLRDEPVATMPLAGFCGRAPAYGAESAPAAPDRRIEAMTCRLDVDGGDAAEARRAETANLCEWRREGRADGVMAAGFCPNPRASMVAQRHLLDFTLVGAVVAAADVCRRASCAILLANSDIAPDDRRPASLSAPGDNPALPAPQESGQIAQVLPLAVLVANGAGVWPAAAQSPYCPAGAAPQYAQLYFQFESMTPAPEPSSWALILVAFLGLGAFGWRRRARGDATG